MKQQNKTQELVLSCPRNEIKKLAMLRSELFFRNMFRVLSSLHGGYYIQLKHVLERVKSRFVERYALRDSGKSAAEHGPPFWMVSRTETLKGSIANSV